jgi:N-acetylmuramic acid 6-phosphate etherase
LGILIAVDREIELCNAPQSPFARFISFFRERGLKTILILVGEGTEEFKLKATTGHLGDPTLETTLLFPLERNGDPLGLNRQLILKMLLNGHSTGVMDKLGRVVGNTMTHVNPSNLKLIGRATSLILTHVNDTLSRKSGGRHFGNVDSISYAEANAVLFDAMSSLSGHDAGTSEVELSIIRILEALKTGRGVSWEEAVGTARKTGLGEYLQILKE